VTTERLNIVPLSYEQLKEYCDCRMGSIVSDKDVAFVYEYHLNPMLKTEIENHIYYTFWIATKDDGEIVGEGGFKGVPNEFAEVELGYFVSGDHRNVGYATEMVRYLVGWALRQDEVKYVVAGVDAQNKASERVLIKNGFHFWGEKQGMNVFYYN